MKSPVLLGFVIALEIIALINGQGNLKPAVVTIPALAKPEVLTAVQKKAVNSPSVDSVPSGKDLVHSNAGNVDAVGPVRSQIISGSLATRGQFAWQTAVQQDNKYFCGGSLIHAQWVLTAAHCAKGITNFVVTLGAQSRDVFEAGRLVFKSRTKFVHPKYNANAISNDIALVKLPSKVATPTSYINLIRLPKLSDATKSFEGIKTNISGWGLTADGGSVAKSMSSVELSVMSNADCAAFYGVKYVLSSNICTSGAGNVGVCNGDSGGPLVYQEADTKWTQIGVVSFGTESCTESSPSVYTRVSSYLGWISKTTGIAISA